ncbi:MAG TPA: outer membrane lipid asymmetry maintenance protein MlaD [Stellaceae bacterium]|nr:outer membrane lipid asymmetry maintenance protein MlaD [Stellaceae bacterium]
MGRNAVETMMGAVVLVVAALFLFFAYTTSQVQSGGGYSLTARFDHVDGVRDGTDVRLSGIKVGSVLSQTLEPKTFVAVLRLNIDRGIQLPTDSVVTITSSGLLGDKYLSIEPGNEDKMIQPGGEITHTQSAMSLESLIGQVIFSAGKKDSGEGGGNASAPPK